MIAQGTPDGLRQSWQGEAVITLELKEGRSDAAEQLAEVAGVAGVEAHGDREFELRCRSGSDPREELFRLAVARDWTLLELARRKASLEDIFVRLTTDDARAADETGDTVESGGEVKH